MRIIFIYHTFPGPFKSLAHELSEDSYNKVLFLSESGQKTNLAKVRKIRLAPPINYETTDLVEKEAVMRLRRAARTGNALLKLRNDNFIPDIIISTSSTAGNIYIKDIFPNAHYIIFSDWFYTKGENYCFFNEGKVRTPAGFAIPRIRNFWEYNALGDADTVIVSSKWQQEQYPKFLQNRTILLHNGINTHYFAPLNIQPEKEIISFSGPYNDPSRGFPQFAKCIPKLLSLRPKATIVIGYPMPTRIRKGQEEKVKEQINKVCQNIENYLDLPEDLLKKVKILGPCQVKDYRNMLQASTVHVYLTSPHTLSTGILEAMASNTLVVASDTSPVREIIQHGYNGFLCDFWDSTKMAETIAGVLERSKSLKSIKQNARNFIVKNYNINDYIENFKKIMIKRIN